MLSQFFNIKVTNVFIGHSCDLEQQGGFDKRQRLQWHLWKGGANLIRRCYGGLSSRKKMNRKLYQKNIKSFGIKGSLIHMKNVTHVLRGRGLDLTVAACDTHNNFSCSCKIGSVWSMGDGMAGKEVKCGKFENCGKSLTISKKRSNPFIRCKQVETFNEFLCLPDWKMKTITRYDWPIPPSSPEKIALFLTWTTRAVSLKPSGKGITAAA